jgi:hypothetical protein
LITSTYATPDQFFVGFNVGEFGGGLRRIDRQSGKVAQIERNASGKLCGGPLNAACDPVTGVAAEPWKPDCIAAAIGLVHFASHGRVVEVCGDQVQRLYFKDYSTSWLDGRKVVQPKDDEPFFSTVAFFGLARDGDTLWAPGIDGIYNIGADGTARIVPLPPFKEIGGIQVSFDLPRFVLVLTAINRRLSMGGAAPLPASR